MDTLHQLVMIDLVFPSLDVGHTAACPGLPKWPSGLGRVIGSGR